MKGSAETRRPSLLCGALGSSDGIGVDALRRSTSYRHFSYRTNPYLFGVRCPYMSKLTPSWVLSHRHSNDEVRVAPLLETSREDT